MGLMMVKTCGFVYYLYNLFEYGHATNAYSILIVFCVLIHIKLPKKESTLTKTKLPTFYNDIWKMSGKYITIIKALFTCLIHWVPLSIPIFLLSN